jgi:hypothetical protein
MNEIQVTDRQFREIYHQDSYYWSHEGAGAARSTGPYARPLMGAAVRILGVIGVAKQAPGLFREAA